MKDTGKAAFFPKKRDREESSNNNNAPINDDDSIIPEVQTILESYVDQMSNFPRAQLFYDNLCDDIGELSEKWEALKSKTTVAEDRKYQRENELEIEGMVTLVDPINHLYIEQLALIREFGTLCADIDDFIEKIKLWINFSDSRIASIKGYLKNANPPYVQVMVADATAMEGMKIRMGCHAAFIKGEMTALKSVYNNGGTDFQKDILEKLSERPELLAWAMPFFNPNKDENVDVLQSALNTLKPSTK